MIFYLIYWFQVQHWLTLNKHIFAQKFNRQHLSCTVNISLANMKKKSCQKLIVY